MRTPLTVTGQFVENRANHTLEFYRYYFKLLTIINSETDFRTPKFIAFLAYCTETMDIDTFKNT